MPDTKEWLKIDPLSHATLELQCIEWAFTFLAKTYENYSPETLERVNRRSIRNRAKIMVRELLENYGKSVDEAKIGSPAERERAAVTVEKLNSVIELLESIPEDHQQILREYDEWYHDLIFSMEAHQIIERSRALFQGRAWKLKGRPSDLVMAKTVGSCVNLLEYIVGRPFKRNFHLEKTSGGLVFTNPDCAFCEGILKLLNPSLELRVIKAAMKSHFAPSRSRPVSYVGPLRKPVYGLRKSGKSE